MSEPFPKFFRIRQRFDDSTVEHLENEIKRTFAGSQAAQLHRFKPGQSVGIAVGSRGISQIALIVKTVVGIIHQTGATPFLIPAMGSHGGATAQGQIAVLAQFGITAEAMGCEIKSSMETTRIGQTSAGLDVHFDSIGFAADHLVLVNRVKPHTRISGPYESGLVKIMMIGLGKHLGAGAYHRAMTRHRFDELVGEVAPMILQAAPVTLGLAIVENAFDEICHVEAIDAQHILDREPELLDMAKRRMPRLPFDDVDLLIVDRLGKNISGAGMDTNVIGRKSNDKCAASDELPKVHEIYVRGLTDETKGNAAGIGIAEYCRSRIVEQMDVAVTRINCLTALHATAAAIPIHYPTDREVLSVAIDQTGRNRVSDVRCLWIKDTLNVGEVMCSEAYWDEANASAFEVIEGPKDLRWKDDGNLVEVFK